MITLSSVGLMEVMTIIGFFYICDVISTYTFLRTLIRNFPDCNNWQDSEINPIVRYFLKKYGLMKGIYLSMFVTSPLIVVIMYVSASSDILFGMVIGIYIVTLRIHVESWKRLRKSIRNREKERILKTKHSKKSRKKD